MGIKESVIEWLGAVSTSSFDERVNRAYEAGFYDGGNDDPASGDFQKGGMGYNRLSDNYIREGKIDYKRALETAWELWQKSPIAKRVLTLKRDHIIGHNAEPTADDDDLLEVVQRFWDDNGLQARASEFTIQLFGFGEQCFPAFVRESDGRVLIGYIDPQSIVKVIKHPDNALEDWAIVTERYVSGAYTAEKLVYRIIREDDDYTDDEMTVAASNRGKLTTWEQSTIQPWEIGMLADHGRQEYDGSCFYFKVNAVSNQSRGVSDLLQVGDWVDQADDVLFSLADREGFAGYFSFDVTLNQASDDQVRKRSREIRMNPPSKGSVNVHNDSEIWQMFAPALNQTGSIETFRAILGLILGGLGFPVHWYGYGDDANRATATAQADPTTKTLEHDQGIVKDMFVGMCRFAADQAEIAGSYTPNEDTDDEIMLQLPEVSIKDVSRIAASASQLVVSLINAVDAGWLTNEKAAEVYAKVLSELDVKIDVVNEMEDALADRDEQMLAQVASQNGRLQKQLIPDASDES